VILTAALTGCVVEQRRPVAEIVAPTAPPPPRYEAVPPPSRPAEIVQCGPATGIGTGANMSGSRANTSNGRARRGLGRRSLDERGGRFVWVEGHWR